MKVPYIRTFSYHYRQKYGFSVGKIPLDLGVECPNRQTGGCIFCRPASFAPGYLNNGKSIVSQIENGKEKLLKSRFIKYFAYFQQETTTSVPTEILMPVFQSVLQDTNCIGLIFSTRPDYVEQQFLDELADLATIYSKECLIELGLQSVHDTSLDLLNRNHSLSDFVDTVLRINRMGCFEVGVHLIFGIPGETESDMLESIQRVCAMKIQALKLHHLQVIKNTTLARMFQEGEVKPFSKSEYIRFLLSALPLIPASVVIHRLWATSHPDLLIAPKWNILATDLSRSLLKEMEKLGVQQGQASS